MAGCTDEEADEMIVYAEEMAEKIEREGEPEFEKPAAEEAPAEAVPEDEQPVAEGESLAEPVIVDSAASEPATSPGGFSALFSSDEAVPATEAIEPSTEETTEPTHVEVGGTEPAPAEHESGEQNLT